MKKYVDGQYIEMTAKEVAEREAQIVIDVAFTKTVTDALAQKETDKANGRQKLKDLGLTDAEVDALIGS
jgi:hypothetical protein